MIRTKVAATAAVEVAIPMTPEVLRTTDGQAVLPIGAISEEALRKIGEAWTEALLEHARVQRRREEEERCRRQS